MHLLGIASRRKDIAMEGAVAFQATRTLALRTVNTSDLFLLQGNNLHIWDSVSESVVDCIQ